MGAMSSSPDPARNAPAAQDRPVRGRTRIGWRTWAGLAAGLLVGWLIWQGPTLVAQAQAGTAYGARMACSCRYVQDRPLTSCEADKEPGMALVGYSEDPATRTVTASVPLIASASARYVPRTGCLYVADVDQAPAG